MSTLLAAFIAYPTVVFTALLGLALVYWIFVILGALDIDMFDADGIFDGADALDGADGALDGAFDGMEGALKGVDGALDGIGALKGVDGALDGIGALKGVDGALDGVGALKGVDGVLDGADGALEGADALDAVEGADGATGLLHALKLRRAPITVTFSFIALFGFIFSYLAMAYVAPIVGAVVPTWVFGSGVLVGAFLLSLPLTSLATKPLEPVFKSVTAKGRHDYVGSVVRVRTGRVDEGFGQADLTDGGSHMVIPVRIDTSTLKRGDEALIIDYDSEREAYIVEAYESLMDDNSTGRKARR